MNKEKIMLGIAPIGWTNDDMPDLGAENTFQQCVSEMALAGFSGCEIGNKYPSDVKVLKKALDLRGMRIANRWFSSFILTKPFEEVEADFRANCAFLQSMGAKRIGASEQSYSIQGTDKAIFDCKPVRLILYSGDQLKALRILGDRHFLLIIIKASCPVVVILDHTTDRNIDMQCLKHFLCDIDLALSTIHQKQIRKLRKAAKFFVQLFFFHLLLFFQSV